VSSQKLNIFILKCFTNKIFLNFKTSFAIPLKFVLYLPVIKGDFANKFPMVLF
jgi:hypothetical protein